MPIARYNKVRTRSTGCLDNLGRAERLEAGRILPAKISSYDREKNWRNGAVPPVAIMRSASRWDGKSSYNFRLIDLKLDWPLDEMI
jgi:hypothetical protein